MRRIVYHEIGGLRHVLADPSRPEHAAWDARIKAAKNDSGELQMSLRADNPTVPMLSAMRSEIVVEDDGIETWRGRLIEPTYELGGPVSVVAKGCLDYLHDTTLSQQVLSGSAAEVFAQIIVQHNAKPIDGRKRFTLGTIDVEGSVDELNVKAGEKTWDAIARLVKLIGGLVRTQRVDGENRIYWQREAAYVCSQKIRFGRNLLSLTDALQTDKLATVMYAYGRTTDDVPLGIEDENDGLPYVCDEEAVAVFGWIEDAFTDSSCEDSAELKTKAEEELAARLAGVRSISARAVDLSDISDAEQIDVGMYVQIVIPSMDEAVQCTSLERYLFEPTRTVLTLGASMRLISNMIGGITNDV